MAVDHYITVLIYIPSRGVWRVAWRFSYRKRHHECASSFFATAGPPRRRVVRPPLERIEFSRPRHTVGWSERDAVFLNRHLEAARYFDLTGFVAPKREPHGLEFSTRSDDPEYVECHICPWLSELTNAIHKLQVAPIREIPWGAEDFGKTLPDLSQWKSKTDRRET